MANEQMELVLETRMTMRMKLDEMRAILHKALAGSDFESCTYFAGGCVRDFLLDMDSSDFDLCVELPDGGVRCAEYLHSQGLASKPKIFSRYGTAMVILNQARLDFVPTLKVINRFAGGGIRYAQGSLRDDVLRRDFSINSLLLRVCDGELLDLSGLGKVDLQQCLIRCTDSPANTFWDDPVRLLRAIRFACELGFSIEQETWSELCRQSIRIGSSPWERVAAEWEKILLSPDPVLGCRLLAASGMLPIVFPELAALISSEPSEQLAASISPASLAAVQNTPADPVLRWTILLHRIIRAAASNISSTPDDICRLQKMTPALSASEILERFEVSGVYRKGILSLLHSIMTLDASMVERTLTDVQLRELLVGCVHDENLLFVLLDAYDQAEAVLGNPPRYGTGLKMRISGQQNKLGESPFTLNGNLIMSELGVAKGPEVGKLLKLARLIWLQNPVISRNELLDELRQRTRETKQYSAYNPTIAIKKGDNMNLLITLVGSNPLPVYVSIAALRNNGNPQFDRILFVFSSGTQCYTGYIRNALERKGYLTNDIYIDFCDLGQDQRNASEIQNKVRDKLEKLGMENGMIHLNYTGGTKTMALNTYLALQDYCNGNDGITIELSDLNPETHRLSIMQGEVNIQIPENGNLLSHIKCDLDDIVKLHGFTQLEEGSRSILAGSYLGMDTNDLYGRFIRGLYENDTLLRDFHNRWNSLRKHKDRIYNWLIDSGYQSLSEINNYLRIPDALNGLGNFGNYETWEANLLKYGEFIDGKWLERYVFEVLQEMINKEDIRCDDKRLGYKVLLEAGRNSELDVIVIKGYQLTLISCTTSSSIGIVKHKAFEAIYRARQLGGEQANIIIVSFLYTNSITGIYKSEESNLECLRADLKAFNLNKNVTLVGRDNLMKSVDHNQIQDSNVKTLEKCLSSVLK